MPTVRHECNLFSRFAANRYGKACAVITSGKAFTDLSELSHDRSS
jgi:hypothetical protein